MSRVLSLALSLALLLPLPALAAARVAVLAFAPLSGDLPVGAGDKAADILANELKTIASLDVVPRAKRDEGAPKAALDLAEKDLAEARAELSARKPKAAQAAYEAALAAFQKALPALASFHDLLECEAELGALHYRRGDDAGGRALLFDAVRLAAGRPIQAIAQAPSYAPIAKRLAAEAAKLAKGSLRIDSTPEGAEVFVDGEDAGKAPVVIRELPKGAHYLRAVLPSGEQWGALARVEGDGGRMRAQSGAEGPAAEIDAELAENRLEPRALESVKQVAATTGAALVVFGALHRTIDGLGLDAFLFQSQGGHLVRLGRVAFDNELLDAGLQMDKLVSQIQSRLSDPGQELRLPAKVAEDQIPEGGLASDYRFGGEQGADASPDAPPPPEQRRVIVHGGGGD